MGRLLLFLLLLCCFLFFALSSSALSKEQSARTREAVGVSAAHRAVVELEKKLSEARHVERATRKARSQYGSSVARWVWLARRTGWPWGDISRLTYIINRESRGVPTATNASSGAGGLLQFMPQWYEGLWGLPAFDPYDPRTNLRMGLRLHNKEGWGPWAL